VETRSVIEMYKEIDNGKREKFPVRTWSKETGIELLRYLIEEKLKWSRDDVVSNISPAVISEYHMASLLQLHGGSLFKALDAAYPGEYKPWELKRVSMGRNFWTLDKAIEATKWLIEEHLKWTHVDVCAKLNKDVFRDTSLGYILNRYFSGAPYKAVVAAYPNEYMPWELRNLPKSFWTRQTILEAVRWLVEEKVGLTFDEAYNFIDIDTFERNKLDKLLKFKFDNDPLKALEYAWRG